MLKLLIRYIVRGFKKKQQDKQDDDIMYKVVWFNKNKNIFQKIILLFQNLSYLNELLEEDKKETDFYQEHPDVFDAPNYELAVEINIASHNVAALTRCLFMFDSCRGC
jgi:hypothetical protein